MVTVGILALTAVLFFILPRTAEAAFSRLIAHRIFLPGFSNQVTLGDIGEIKTNSRPVMHIKIWSALAGGAAEVAGRRTHAISTGSAGPIPTVRRKRWPWRTTT